MKKSADLSSQLPPRAAHHRCALAAAPAERPRHGGGRHELDPGVRPSTKARRACSDMRTWPRNRPFVRDFCAKKSGEKRFSSVEERWAHNTRNLFNRFREGSPRCAGPPPSERVEILAYLSSLLLWAHSDPPTALCQRPQDRNLETLSFFCLRSRHWIKTFVPTFGRNLGLKRILAPL